MDHFYWQSFDLFEGLQVQREYITALEQPVNVIAFHWMRNAREQIAELINSTNMLLKLSLQI